MLFALTLQIIHVQHYHTITCHIHFVLVREWEKRVFYWCIDFEKYFGLIYQDAEVFEYP